MTSNKLPVAILGTGNIGTDLLVKVQRSTKLECVLFAGRNLSSPGMTTADGLGVPVSAKGLAAVLAQADDIALVFDATNAKDHLSHAPEFASRKIRTIDLTPAKVGQMCVPAVNLEGCLSLPNINMVTCGGQASIPLANAICRANPSVEYIEAVSSIASRSAGPATRLNIDEYLETTEGGLKELAGCKASKAILNLNPANPCVHMQTTVMARVTNPDVQGTRDLVTKMVSRVRQYVPGYQLLVEPMLEGDRLLTMVRVDGAGDYLPKYAGNLDIINCAAIACAEGATLSDSS
jgi:acetaldehyde dehydrogenase